MDQDYSNGDTDVSSVEIQQHQLSKTSLIFSTDILQHFLLRLKRFAFKKMMRQFLPFHPQKFQSIIERARFLLREKKFDEAYQQAQISLKCLINNDNSSFQQATFLMVECQLQRAQLASAKQLIKKVSDNDQIIFEHKYFMLMMKICQIEHDEAKSKIFFTKLQHKLSGINQIDKQQISQIIIFCGDILLSFDLRSQAATFLLKWLPILISYGNSQNIVIAKIYIQLAEICQRNKNLQHQFAYLCCASLTIVNQFEHYSEYLEIQCKKLNNLMERRLAEKVSEQIERVFINLREKMSRNLGDRQKLKVLVSDLLSHISYNNENISKKQRELLQMFSNVSQLNFYKQMQGMYVIK